MAAGELAGMERQAPCAHTERTVYVLRQHGPLSWHASAYLKIERERGAWKSSPRVNLSEERSSFPGVLALLCKTHFVFSPLTKMCIRFPEIFIWIQISKALEIAF